MDVGIIGSRGFPVVYSGYETLVSELAPRLVSKGHEVTVYCHRRVFSAWPDVVDGVRLAYVRGLGGKNAVQLTHSAAATLRAMLRRHDVVLFVNVANAPFAGFLAANGIPSVINVDGVEWQRPKWSALGQRYFYWAAQVAARWATALVADAHEIRRLYEESFSRASTMIAYGCPTTVAPDWDALSSRGLERDRYFLVMGRLIPDNNGDLIASEFVRSGSDQKLVILGDVPYAGDPYAAGIRRTFESSDVLFTGYVSDPAEVQALLEGCFGYLHGHEFGGTNPSLVWAMGAGCRILALDTRFSREMLDGGSCGAFFTKEPGSLADLIGRCQRDSAGFDQRAEAARARALDAYSWEEIASDYERLLESVCEDRRA